MNKFKKLRKEINLSQTQLAAMLNVSQTTVSQWETGKNYPDVNTLRIISDTFCVSTDYLLDLKLDNSLAMYKATVYTRIPAGLDWGTNLNRDGDIDISPRLMASGEDFIAYRLIDEHLRPYYFKDDTFIIELTDQVENGGLALVQIGGYDAEISRVFRTPNGTMIQSVLPEIPAKFFPQKGKEQPRILGVVRELHRYL